MTRNKTTPNTGFGKSGADGITMNFCNSVQFLFGLDGMLFGFLLLSSSSVFQSAAVPGGRNTISPPSPSPVRWQPLKKYTMKQTIMTMGLISGLLGLLGCDNKTSDKTNKTDTSKVETINPNDILFTTPTLENALPEFESTTDTSNLHFHEDDWRQIEFISKNQKNQIDTEILKIKDIYDKFSHKADTYTAFKQVAIRELIKEPLTLSFSKLKYYLADNDIKLKGVTLDGNTGQVKNGFSFKTGGVEFYGVVERNDVKTLCLYSADSEEQLKASFDKLSKLLKTENLYLVDWVKMKVLDENSIRTGLLTDEK